VVVNYLWPIWLFSLQCLDTVGWTTGRSFCLLIQLQQHIIPDSPGKPLPEKHSLIPSFMGVIQWHKLTFFIYYCLYHPPYVVVRSNFFPQLFCDYLYIGFRNPCIFTQSFSSFRDTWPYHLNLCSCTTVII